MGQGRRRIKEVVGLPCGGKSLIGEQIAVAGWVKTMRVQGGGSFAFIELNDGSCFGSLQVMVDKTGAGFDALVEKAGTGASIKAVGRLVESPAKGQAVELVVKEEVPGSACTVLGGVDAATYPLAKKQHTIDYLRTIAHLRPRSNIIGAAARVRSNLAMATHEFFQSRGFLYVHTPCLTGSDCEGAGEMFQVTTMIGEAEKAGGQLPMKDGKVDYSKDFFGKHVGLTVSGQLNVENYACALSDCYTFGPTFRAENSHTYKHLAEFWMIEPELAFADLTDDMDCAEAYLKFCVEWVLTHNEDDLAFFEQRVEKGLRKRLEQLIAEPFKRISYTEAIEVLQKEEAEKKKTFERKVEWGMDLGSEHERYLVEKVFLKPTIVYNYPKDIKAFYMRLNDDEKTCAAMDVLCPIVGEVIGGSAREERLDVLDRRIKEMNLDEADYWWYRDLRKYGTIPHAGFGLGFERLIMLCTGIENIRETIPFPRYPGHAEF